MVTIRAKDTGERCHREEEVVDSADPARPREKPHGHDILDKHVIDLWYLLLSGGLVPYRVRTEVRV